MALQKNETFRGLTATGAYHRIHYVAGNKDEIGVQVRVYKDAATAANLHDHFEEFSFKVEGANLSHDGSASDKNYTEQAYEFMKNNAFNDSEGNARDYTTGTTDV